MLEDLKKYINVSYNAIDKTEMEYSKDGKEVKFMRILGNYTTIDYYVKIIDQKTFKDNNDKDYKVTFLIEDVDEKTYHYLVAFIEVKDEYYFFMHYDFIDDEYDVSNSKNGKIIFKEDLKKNGISKDLRLIFKQSFDYMEQYNKKKIQRLLNKEDAEMAINLIKDLI